MPQFGAIVENIAFLSLLDQSHEEPASNPIPDTIAADDERRRSLPFKHEKQIAEAFAVLLATTDDPRKVGAVCVEERRDGAGLIIRTAVNTGLQNDRENVFRRIANTIKAASIAGKSSTDELEVQLLNDIVSACQSRLLCRIRSRHAPPSQGIRRLNSKPPVIPKLHKVAQILEARENDSVVQLISQLNQLTSSFTKLEESSKKKVYSERGRQLILDILHQTRTLITSTDFVFTLKSIPKDMWLRVRLEWNEVVKHFQKLSQYLEAARYLLYAARKFPLFQRIDIEVAQIPPPGNLNLVIDLEESGLFSRKMATDQDGFLQVLRSRLRMSSGIEEELNTLAKQHKRLHAEMRLLFYYEQRPEIVHRPRVLCSNKRACYLCDLFIKSHGGFYAPETHGRLYSTWRLPTKDEMALEHINNLKMRECLNRFNDALEDKIRLSLQRRQKLPAPAESIIFNPASYTVSIVSSPDIIEADGTPTDIISSGISRERPLGSDISNATIKSRQITSDKGITMAGPRTIVSQSKTIDSCVFSLFPGISQKVLVRPGYTIRFRTPHVHLEYVTEKVPDNEEATTSQSDISLEIEWISEDKVNVLGDLDNLIDLDSLTTAVNVEDMLFTPQGLRLKAKHGIISLKATHENML